MELDYHKDPSLLNRLIDSIAAGVFTVDAQGNFVSWSDGAERITGYSRDEMVGKSCTVLEGQNCQGFAALKHMLANPDPCALHGVCNQECKLSSKEGRELYIHGNVRLLMDEAGSVAGAVGCFTDLTEFVEAHERVSLLEEQTRQRVAFDRLVGSSLPMQEVFRRLRLAGESSVTVFISGESGTGKELAAGAIHSVSDRREKPFIAVNCSAIPETLLESELFGHVKGAFTGAIRDKTGLFQAAEGGTLFLDEIGDVSPLMQVKLLRVLQEKEIRRVGDEKTIPVNVRIITATNRDLKSLIRQGEFREDFYYRIHVFEIPLPPLRERREDIPLLVDRFIRDLAATLNPQVQGIARDALQRLMEYNWPGNVRELRNAIEHAFVTVRGDRITLLDLPLEIREHPLLAQTRSANLTAPKETSPSELPSEEQTEKARIQAALEETGGNKAAAARLLGISRVTMWKKTKKYQLG